MGHSFGGILAQALVRESPGMFRKVILSHTTAVDGLVPNALIENALGLLSGC